jgi:hypothetical protein
MGNPFEPSPPDYHTELLIQVGKLVLTWNDLDQWIRHLIYLIAMNDALTVMVLTADMRTSAALNALRALTIEQDATAIRSFRRRAAKHPDLFRPGETGPQAAAPHVQHFIDYVDRLREYRNFYVHGIGNPNPDQGFQATGKTARGRLSAFKKAITPRDLELLTGQIQECIRYALALFHAIDQNHPFARFAPGASPPTWPEKPPLPDKLKKPRLVLLDETDPPQPSEA